MSSITVERIGRRSYLRGDTYSARATLKSAGCHWDGDQRAWWIGSHEDALRLAGEAQASAPATYEPAADEAFVPVGGNTYPAREQLRALGGRWDGARKAWLVPASQLAAADKVVASAPREPYRPRKCRACGSEPRIGRRGYVENGVYLGRDGLCSDCRDEARMGY